MKKKRFYFLIESLNVFNLVSLLLSFECYLRCMCGVQKTDANGSHWLNGGITLSFYTKHNTHPYVGEIRVDTVDRALSEREEVIKMLRGPFSWWKISYFFQEIFHMKREKLKIRLVKLFSNNFQKMWNSHSLNIN